jgi:hypothetical protein
MNTPKTLRKLQAGVLALVVAAACGGADVLGPLVILTNSWEDAADPQHIFNFTDDTGFTPQRSGTFTGTETVSGGTQFNLSGSWSENGKIQFTVQRATAVTYRGTLNPSNTDRIDFTSSAGALTILRQ